MARGLSTHAGYLSIDHRDSPGLTPADIRHVPGAVAVGPGQRFEADVKQCSHCQRSVVLNPGRVRDRAVCQQCYHYICDSCKAMQYVTGTCVPFLSVLDYAATQLARDALYLPDPRAIQDRIADTPLVSFTL